MHTFAARVFLCLTFLAALSAAAQQVDTGGGWIDSPEAYFATNAEVNEWVGVKTDAAKQAFIERYWLRRDPTPGTPRNEFRELVMGRITTADQKFSIDTTKGSTTARGMVFILFGSPATLSEQNSGVPARTGSGGEWSQVLATWKYDRFRTKKLLELIDRPELIVKFLITPSEKTDVLQDPGLFSHYRKTIAEASVVTKDAVVAPSGPVAMVETAPLTVGALPDVAIAELSAAATAASTLRTSTYFGSDGKPLTLFWVTVPGNRTPTAPATLYGRVADAQQNVVATVAKEMRAAEGFTTRTGDVVYAVSLPLAPGTYESVFAVHAGANAIASGAGRVIVPATGSGLDVSSLVLTHDLMSAEPPAIMLGGAPVRPRADAVFATDESLWYAFQVASETDPGNVNAKLVLRRVTDSKTQTSSTTTGLTQTGPGSFIGGFEIPLQTVEPGDYSIYVTLTDAAGKQQVRRADFKVVAP
ncbi:MAG TPA: GWxTD domain-containing protein [Thermoanaerobaculia bacterium]